MSEPKAEEQTEIVDTGEVIDTPEETKEVEIVLEGADASPEPVPQWVNKRFGRYAKKVKQANSETEAVQAQLQAVKQENELLRLNTKQQKTKERPDEDDFESRSDYLKADQQWQDDRSKSVIDERFQELSQANQSQTQQAEYSDNIDTQIDSHYERVAKLRMPNYSDLEGKAADILGDDMCREILANSEDSHLVMAHLGANPSLAQQYKSMALSQPVKALLDIGRLGARLSVKPKNSTTPDPETKIPEGESTTETANQRKLDKLRDEAAQSGDMSKLIAFKKGLRESGVTL